jgi:alpha-beta hydrolase superfamily lysophospholipase
MDGKGALMPGIKPLVAGAAAGAGGATLLASVGLLTLGQRFIRDFTRPGVSVDPNDPLWGGWGFPEAVAEPPSALRRAVTFVSADGAVLRGEFWAQPDTAPTIVISHGFHLPSAHFRSVAALEYAHGANVFLFDYRGHGQSAQIATTCGPAEVNDLLAAVEVAAQQPETRAHAIYVHGFSMGAAVALLMSPHPAVAGIIADSPYARLDEMILKVMALIFAEETARLPGPTRLVRRLIPLLSRLTYLSGLVLYQARHRLWLAAHPERAIQRRKQRHRRLPADGAPSPILLIHAEQDPFISVGHARRLAAAARAVGRPVVEYYTPSPVHCGSYAHDPSAYIALLYRFVAA